MENTMILHKYMPTNWKVYIQGLWEQTVSRVWSSLRVTEELMRKNQNLKVKKQQKAKGTSTCKSPVARGNNGLEKQRKVSALKQVSMDKGCKMTVGRWASEFKSSRALQAMLENWIFILSTKGLSFFYTVDCILTWLQWDSTERNDLIRLEKQNIDYLGN